jgi:2,4-dienoyl-CoA reductase (NADPH2)
VELKLGTRVEAKDLAGYDKVVLATGIKPRKLTIPGANHPKVCVVVSHFDERCG